MLPPRLRPILLAAVVAAVAALARLPRLGADLPLDVETTNAPALDAFWYLQEAAARADGVLVEPAPAYDLAPWTLVARGWFAVFGGGYVQACALGAALGIATVILVFLAARPLGERAALGGALLLAVSYPFAQQGRSPLIYGFVALVLIAAAALFVRGTRGSRACAWAIALAAPFYLKAPAAALLGGLALAELARSERPLRVLLLLLGGGAACAALVVVADPGSIWTLTRQRLANYVGDFDAGELALRALLLGARSEHAGDAAANASGVAYLSPGPLALAAIGAAFAWRDLRGASGPRRDALAVALGWAVAFVMAAAPFTYRPIRYFVPVFPAACLLAGHALERLLGPAPDAGTRPRAIATVILAAPFGALLGAHATDVVAAFFHRPAPLTWLLAVAFSGSALVTLAFVFRLSVPRVACRLVAIGLICLATLDGLRDMRAVVGAQGTSENARAVFARVVGPRAVLSGPYSTFLAIGTGRERRLGATLGVPATPEDFARELRQRGYTHMALDVEQGYRSHLQGRLAAAGAPMHLVAVFYVRLEPVFVYRFDWAEELGYTLTPFEEGRRLEERHEPDAAEHAFEGAGALDDSELVLAHVRALVHGGDWEQAKVAARAAAARHPETPELARLLADMEHLVPEPATPEGTAAVGSH